MRYVSGGDDRDMGKVEADARRRASVLLIALGSGTYWFISNWVAFGFGRVACKTSDLKSLYMWRSAGRGTPSTP
ncbi:hypothetical protein X734_28710 [Mesorhizobium sp. L2C084A000]|nr:hypothetical protein X734_28710 [Mesorhizobium sp. L2C084A000]